MSSRQPTKIRSLILIVGLLAQPQWLWACAACYGQDSGPMARGMNWGIFSLLAIIVCVLAAIAGFFIYLVNRSANLPAAPLPGKLASSSEGL